MVTETATVWAERIERLRKALPKERRPSVGDLIRHTRVSRSRWYRLMSGESELSVGEAQRLASALHVAVETLLPDMPQEGSRRVDEPPKEAHYTTDRAKVPR